jgi:CRP/FNR family cyclic AMP-dependent transcriptional regulator
MELEQRMTTIPLLAGLDGRVRKRLVAVGKQRKYDADEAIIEEDQVGTALYIILSGSVRVERGGTEIARLGSGDFFGELALIEQHPRSATVIANEVTECLLFPAWEFTALLSEHPEIAVPIMRALIDRIHRREHHEA